MDINFDLQKINAIFGLGNIGEKYLSTRHNVGFLFLDFLAQKSGQDSIFKSEKPFNALGKEIQVNYIKRKREPVVDSEAEEEKKFTITTEQISKDLRLIKPQTMMNNSGDSVVKYLSYYKVRPKNIIVVYDDLDLQLGNFKLQYGKVPKVHNGVNSIIKSINSDQFWSIRIGVDNRSEDERKYLEGYEYVLSKFKKDEIDILSAVFEKIYDRLINNMLQEKYN